MNYCEIKKTDIANGSGVRVTLFVSGCRHHCKGCFQPDTWNFDYGKPFTDTTADEIINALSKGYIKGLTLLGGEPMEPENQPELTKLLHRVKTELPDKDVWCYTGCTLETDLLAGSKSPYRTQYTDEMLSLIDYLVDGEFVLEKKNISLKFRDLKIRGYFIKRTAFGCLAKICKTKPLPVTSRRAVIFIA